MYSRMTWIKSLMTVCSYHVRYAFQSESTLYGCLIVKELLARNRCKIWSLIDYNGPSTKWLCVRVPLQSLKLQISCLFRARSSLTLFVYELSGCGFEPCYRFHRCLSLRFSCFLFLDLSVCLLLILLVLFACCWFISLIFVINFTF